MKCSVACAQLDCKTLDTDANLAAAETSVQEAAGRGARLVLLPEYAANGLLFDRRIVEQAKPLDGDLTQRFRNWSQRYGCWIGAGIAEKAGDRFHNTLVLISPTGETWHYRKRYLAFFENLTFTRGLAAGIVSTDLGRIGLMICWDMVHSRLVREMRGNVDLLLIASAWPDLTTGNIPLPGIQSWLSKPPRVQPAKLARQLGVPVMYCNMGGRFTTLIPGLGLTYESALAGRSAIHDTRGDAVQVADHADSCLLIGDVEISQTFALQTAA